MENTKCHFLAFRIINLFILNLSESLQFNKKKKDQNLEKITFIKIIMPQIVSTAS